METHFIKPRCVACYTASVMNIRMYAWIVDDQLNKNEP